jgi:hypothetical protein
VPHGPHLAPVVLAPYERYHSLYPPPPPHDLLWREVNEGKCGYQQQALTPYRGGASCREFKPSPPPTCECKPLSPPTACWQQRATSWLFAAPQPSNPSAHAQLPNSRSWKPCECIVVAQRTFQCRVARNSS